MKKLSILFAVLLSLSVYAQSDDQNYVQKTTYTEAFAEGQENTALPDQKIESISYFDGLGRHLQSVNVRSGGNKENIVQYSEYDAFGRSPKQYLPMATDGMVSGDYLEFTPQQDLRADILNFYDTPKYELTQNPYSETIYEASPRSRPLEQGAPGNAWIVDPTSDTDHTVKLDYGYNRDTDLVRNFDVSFPTGVTDNPQLVMRGYFDPTQLVKSIAKDENWTPTSGKDHTTEQFTNKKGQIVLKRVYAEGVGHDTYYVYDAFGNLTYVIPPKASDNLTSENYSGEFAQQFIDVGHFWSTRQPYYPEQNSGGVNISFENEVLTVAFDLTMQQQWLRNGIYGTQTIIPDMVLGAMNPNGSEYTVSFNDGYLYISGQGNVTSIQQTFTVNLPQYGIDQATFDQLCYEYHYDHRNRLIEKREPGRDFDYIVYNKRDLPILTQDGNMRENDQWLFTKYDDLGRVTYTGMHTYENNCDQSPEGSLEAGREEKWNREADPDPETGDTLPPIYIYPYTLNHCTRSALQELVDNHTMFTETREDTAPFANSGASVQYTNLAYPTQNIEVLTISYYDDYNFNWNKHASFSNPATVQAYGQTIAQNTHGLPTGSLVKILNHTDWITSYTVYDTDAQPIYAASYNSFLNTADVVKSNIEFSGAILESETQHRKTGQSTITTSDTFTYDHQKRLVSQKQNINGQGWQLISQNEYDELGRLSRKQVGGETTMAEDFGSDLIKGLQKVDLRYTVRGWIKEINNVEGTVVTGDDNFSGLFNFKINYETIEASSNSTALYNGNIAETLWRTGNVDGNIKGYSYQYDAMNRFTQAQFVEKGYDPSGLTQNSFANLPTYAEQIEGYDKNGNILGLSRTGGYDDQNRLEIWDNLDYSYTGNQLDAVREKNLNASNASEIQLREEGFYDGQPTGIDYNYDKNGNMLTDANKGITSISYNHLNLPLTVTVDGNSLSGVQQGTISYVYDALGSKLQKIVAQASGSLTSTYAGGYIYETVPALAETLKFFGQPEGYVEPNVQGGFDYIFQYTDHLGNVRLSYKSLDNEELENDTFSSGTNGWLAQENTTTSNTGGQLQVSFPAGSGSGLEKAVTVAGSSRLNVSLTSSNVVGIKLIVNEYSGGQLIKTQDRVVPPSGGGLQWEVLTAQETDQVSLRFEEGGIVPIGGTVGLTLDAFTLTQDALAIVEENNYYPFGLKHKGYNHIVQSSNPALKYKHNGVEFEEALGLNMSAMYYRMHDPAIGRWNGIDPVTHWDYSPYSAFDNNPVYYADPWGANSQGGTFNELVNYLWDNTSANGGSSWFGSTGFFDTFGQNEAIGYGKAGAFGPNQFAEPEIYESSFATLPGVNIGSINGKKFNTFSDEQSNQIQNHIISYFDGTLVDRTIDESSIAAEIADITTDFIPLVGSGKDIINGARNGDWGLLAIGIVGIIVDVGTLGTGSIVKGAIKTGIKQGIKRAAIKKSTKLLNQFNSVESLINSSKFTKLGRSNEVLQTTIKGNGDDIFDALSRGGLTLPSGAVQLSDGTVLFKHVSKKTGEFTLDINRSGQLYKVRIN